MSIMDDMDRISRGSFSVSACIFSLPNILVLVVSGVCIGAELADPKLVAICMLAFAVIQILVMPNLATIIHDRLWPPHKEKA